MTSMHEPDSSPRLDRLLRAAAGRQPAGLTDRLFEASVSSLPAAVPSPWVLHRTGFRWLAAAAALLLAAGVSLRLMQTDALDATPDLTLTMVIEGADDTSLGEDIVQIGGLRDTGLSDLDDEMSRLLADARVGG
jgi:hypothetical protein